MSNLSQISLSMWNLSHVSLRMRNLSKYVKSLPNLSENEESLSNLSRNLSQLSIITRGIPTLEFGENSPRTEVYAKNGLKETNPPNRKYYSWTEPKALFMRVWTESTVHELNRNHCSSEPNPALKEVRTEPCKKEKSEPKVLFITVHNSTFGSSQTSDRTPLPSPRTASLRTSLASLLSSGSRLRFRTMHPPDRTSA